jgi:hypothetical protein
MRTMMTSLLVGPVAVLHEVPSLAHVPRAGKAVNELA